MKALLFAGSQFASQAETAIYILIYNEAVQYSY